jgi:ADP-ribose pyrophosphatase YjhB (NUDIX family)
MFIKYFYKVVHRILRIYWYIFKPKTSGVLCLIEFDRRYLLVKNTYGNDVWKLPGGGIQKTELPEKAIVREIHEELNIKLNEVVLLETLVSNAEYKTDTIFIFRSIINSSTFLSDKKEIEEAKWFSKDNLPNNINIFALNTIKNHMN